MQMTITHVFSAERAGVHVNLGDVLGLCDHRCLLAER